MPQMIESIRPRRKGMRPAAPHWVAVTGRLLLVLLIAVSSLLTPLVALPVAAGEAQEVVGAARTLAPAGTGDVPLEGFLDVGSCREPNYGVAGTGIGLFQSTTSGTMNLTLPAGSTPEGAYVFWNGADSNGNSEGDPQIGWTDPVLGSSTLTPAQGYGGALWEGTPSLPGLGTNIHYAWSYRADVTNYSGSGAYGVSHVGVLPGGTFNVYNNGAGMLALYRNPSLGPQRVQIAHGLDLMQGDTLPSSGPGGEPLAFDFAPESSARTARLISLVGGILNPATQPHELWYLTGSGAKPTGDIYGLPGAQVISNPFTANNGVRWDTYQTTATIPANASWIIIQLRSLPTQGGPDSTAPRLEWIAQSFALPLDCPDLGDQTFVDWNNNGVYDSGVDQPFPNNITVSLTGPGGYTNSTTATGGQDSGNYLFQDLPAPNAPATGAFTASVPPQTGYTNTTPLSQTGNLTYPGPDALDVDFGFLPNSGIQVVKTVSLNGDCPGQDPVLITGPTAVTYCFVVTNTGGTTLTNVTVTDNVLVPSLICTISILAPGASQTCTRVVTISESTTNIATATGVPSQPNGTPIPTGVVPVSSPSDTDEAVITVQQPGLNVDKRLTSPATGNTSTGNTVVFDVVLTNSGDTVLTTVSLTDAWSDACLELQTVTPNPGPPDSSSCLGGGACSVGWNNVGPLNPGQSKTFTFTFLARYNPIPTIPPTTPDCAPTTNTATSSGVDANGTPVGPQSDDAPVNIYQPAVEVVKTVSLNGQCPGVAATTVPAGTQVTYCYQVTNTGDTALAPVTVTDNVLGAICSISSLAPGASQTCTTVATVTTDTTNVGTASGTPVGDTGAPIPGVEPVRDTDTATVDVVRPGIQLDKTVRIGGACPGQDSITAPVGTTVTYCYVVTNTGDTYLTNVTVTDNVLGAICTIPLLAPGASQTCTATATVTQNTTNVGTATGQPSDPQGNPLPSVPPVTSEDTATVTVSTTGIQLDKTVSLNGQCPGQNSVQVASGTTVTYCYVVTNTGANYLSNIQVTDNLLGAICTIPLLAPGASQTCTQTALILTDTTNVGTATGQPSDPNGTPIPGAPPVTDQDDAIVDVVAPQIVVDKTVSLDGNCPGQNTVAVAPGTAVTYCYRVTNSGDTYLSNIQVTDNLLGTICTIPLLAPGASQNCTATATITQDTTNVGTATGTPSTPNGTPLPGVPPVTDTDDAVVDVVRPALVLEKTVSLNGQCPGQNSLTVAPGTAVTYCYVVTNTGDTYVANIQVTDNVLGAICTIPLLAPGTSQTCTQVATVTQTTTNVGTATGQPSNPNGEPLPGIPPVTDTDEATVTTAQAGIQVVKTVGGGQCPGQNSVVVVVGTVVTYCYVVTNTGTTYLANIQVTDNVLGPICTIPLLAPGASQTCTAVANINQDVTNVGTASGTPSDSQGNPVPGLPPVNDTDDAIVEVIRPSLVIDKSVSTDGTCPGQSSVAVAAGTTVTYCYLVTNTGDTRLANVTVTDDKLGAICTIPSLLPGQSQNCTQTAVITQSVTNVGTATGTPVDNQGNPFPSIPPVSDITDTDSAVVSTGEFAGAIGDLIWRDLNVDGYPSPGEPGIPGVQVCLHQDVNGNGVLDPADVAALLGCQFTDANGGYLFVGLPAGTYLVNLPAANFQPGGPLEGLYLTSRFTLGPNPLPVSLAQDQIFLNADMGFARAGIDIQKRVGTGCCCGGELATILAGQTVKYCYTVTNTGDTWLSNVVITDDVLGFICQVPIILAPGQSYTCTKEVAVQADVCNIGTATGNPSDNKGDDLTEFPNVSDQDGACVDVVQPAIDIVKTVTTANGTCPGQDSISVGPGTVVKYCYVVTNTGDTHLTAVTVTDDKLGFVCFVPGTLAPGASTTCSALGTINQTTLNTGTASGDPSDATGTPYPNMPDATDSDTAVAEVCRAGLGDMVWIDFYITDGIQQPQETLGIPGVPIIVVNSSGQQVATAITGPDGKYAINNLPPGTYTVIVGSAPGYLLTSPGVLTTTLVCGQVDNSMDFGFVDTTAVTLQSLAAQRQGNKTVVRWSTHSEEGNQGFHVWRALRANGPYVRLTSRPVASKAPVNGGATYSYTDNTVQDGQTYWYRIETTPDGELFGPVSDAPQSMRKLFLPMLLRDR